MKILTVVGARPQFVKAAMVSRAIGAWNTKGGAMRLEEEIIHTGQHFDSGMSQVFFDELGIPAPAVNLGISGGTHGEMTGAMLAGIERVLIERNPALVVVYGDTNSTLAAALAAAKLHIPVAHVEAGLRSFNKKMPEEINRICTDHVSSLLFCSSETGRDHLLREGIAATIEITGDVMADALAGALARISEGPKRIETLLSGRAAGEFAVLTLHRAENTGAGGHLRAVFAALGESGTKVIFPVHPRTRALLKTSMLEPPANVHLLEPVGYLDMAALLGACSMVITDSGGLQKEAYWAHKPCITLREETEWVETVSCGWNVLTGMDPIRLLSAMKCPPSAPEHPTLYGDGRAAERIVAALAAFLAASTG